LLEDEVYSQTKFYDMGALVYHAKIIEWEFPGFSVDTHFENLCRIHTELIENGYVSGIQHRFIVVAKKKIDELKPYTKKYQKIIISK